MSTHCRELYLGFVLKEGRTEKGKGKEKGGGQGRWFSEFKAKVVFIVSSRASRAPK